ncbi:MAG: hypothetical protein M3441_24275 [Chloroflexota bacterium]|nr:hypothetical protein [Chloroflexota bacterium]
MVKVVKKVMFVGRAATFMVGLAVILALTVGVAGAAFGANGAQFILGQTNTVNAITKLVGSVAGPSLQIDNNSTDAAATALDLQVEAGKAPMKVNSSALVANLNVDKVDGLNASQLGGLSGVEQVGAPGALNSTDIKTTFATCPEGKVAIGGGSRMNGFINVAALHESRQVFGDPRRWVVSAHEPVPTDKEWELGAFAICASARP